MSFQNVKMLKSSFKVSKCQKPLLKFKIVQKTFCKCQSSKMCFCFVEMSKNVFKIQKNKTKKKIQKTVSISQKFLFVLFPKFQLSKYQNTKMLKCKNVKIPKYQNNILVFLYFDILINYQLFPLSKS